MRRNLEAWATNGGFQSKAHINTNVSELHGMERVGRRRRFPRLGGGAGVDMMRLLLLLGVALLALWFVDGWCWWNCIRFIL